jgi:hypothetical protein
MFFCPAFLTKTIDGLVPYLTGSKKIERNRQGGFTVSGGNGLCAGN